MMMIVQLKPVYSTEAYWIIASVQYSYSTWAEITREAAHRETVRSELLVEQFRVIQCVLVQCEVELFFSSAVELA